MFIGSVGSSLNTPGTGSKGTPVRIRSDIQSDRRIRTVNLAPSQDGIPMSQGNKKMCDKTFLEIVQDMKSISKYFTIFVCSNFKKLVMVSRN